MCGSALPAAMKTAAMMRAVSAVILSMEFLS
jgi:hypothetical protein